MGIELFVTISLGLLAALAGAMWYLTPKQSEVSNSKNLCWSKLIEKQTTLELEFYERLNNFYTPPAPGVASQFHQEMYGDLRSLASHYVEERDNLLSKREMIISTDKSINYIRQLQIGNCVFYIILFIAGFTLHMENLLKLWMYIFIWSIPWLFLLIFNSKQTLLLGSYDEN